MIDPSDPDYIDTKLVKLGSGRMSPAFQELANWIALSNPGVLVLNVYYDKFHFRDKTFLPRLSVIFETECERNRFLLPDGISFDPIHQAKISAQFEKILESQSNTTFDTKEVLVIFEAFEPVARTEANWRVSKEQLAGVIEEIKSPEIWTIRQGFESAVFFFYTDEQLRSSEESGLRRSCADAYASVLRPYDEFGYFQANPISVTFDSKENFETTYGGSWFYFDRR